MTIAELKAHAYDCLVNIETWQKELQATNEKIKEELTKKPVPTDDTTPIIVEEK